MTASERLLEEAMSLIMVLANDLNPKTSNIALLQTHEQQLRRAAELMRDAIEVLEREEGGDARELEFDTLIPTFAPFVGSES